MASPSSVSAWSFSSINWAMHVVHSLPLVLPSGADIHPLLETTSPSVGSLSEGPSEDDAFGCTLPAASRSVPDAASVEGVEGASEDVFQPVDMMVELNAIARWCVMSSLSRIQPSYIQKALVWMNCLYNFLSVHWLPNCPMYIMHMAQFSDSLFLLGWCIYKEVGQIYLHSDSCPFSLGHLSGCFLLLWSRACGHHFAPWLFPDVPWLVAYSLFIRVQLYMIIGLSKG